MHNAVMLASRHGCDLCAALSAQIVAGPLGTWKINQSRTAILSTCCFRCLFVRFEKEMPPTTGSASSFCGHMAEDHDTLETCLEAIFEKSLHVVPQATRGMLKTKNLN